MNKGLAVVGSVGLGAALMYIFDPDRGKRRRALLRDKVEATGNKLSDKVEKMGRDLSNRAYGVVAETKSIFQPDEVTDDVLVDRVRSRLGRIPAHISAFDLAANDGVVTLRGQILADEVPHVHFQCERLAMLFHSRSRFGLWLTLLSHRLLFLVIVVLVWAGHRRALRAGGYSWQHFWRAGWDKMSGAWRRMDPRFYPCTPNRD